jgi:hypothetical protein
LLFLMYIYIGNVIFIAEFYFIFKNISTYIIPVYISYLSYFFVYYVWESYDRMIGNDTVRGTEMRWNCFSKTERASFKENI